MAYIQEQSTRGCVLCRLRRSKCDVRNRVLMRSKYCFALLNRFPYNNGHTMVVINRHARGFESLSEAEVLDMMRITVKIQAVLTKSLSPHGFNIGINIGKFAGAGIQDHLHIHIVPRWSGDTNFMPVTASTKVISQSLNELYRQLRHIYVGEKLPPRTSATHR